MRRAVGGPMEDSAGATPRISILVVTFEGARYLEALARSLGDLQGAELIVVDNASTDGSADLATKLWPHAVVVSSRTNLGFCGGNNLAARHATGDVLVLLNQDTVVRPGWLAPLVEALRDPSIGIAQAKVLLHDQPDHVNAAGCGFNYLMFAWAQYNGQRDRFHGAPFEVPYCQGAALAIRRDLFLRLGGFDEDHFMYHDDLDLGLKARLSGLRCVCVPDSVVLHKYNPQRTPRKMYLLERNRHHMLFKYYRRATRWKLYPVAIPIELGILVLALVQGWLPHKLRAIRDAHRMRLEAPPRFDPGRPYTDRELLQLLGSTFDAGHVAPTFAERFAARLLRAYYPIAMRWVR